MFRDPCRFKSSCATGYYSGGQDYYTHMESNGFDLHIDKGPQCGVNCSVSDWPNHGAYRCVGLAHALGYKGVSEWPNHGVCRFVGEV